MADSIVVAPTKPWFYGPAGGVTTLPPGEIVLTDTLFIDGQFGPVLTGSGQFLTTICWQGPPDRPVIALRHCTMADVGNFTIRFDKPASHAIVMANFPTIPPGTPVGTKCRIHDIWIEGGGKIGDGIRIDSGYYGGPDQNNDLNRIERCRISGFTGAAVSILSGQSHLNVISDCEITNPGQIGTGVYAQYGSQTMTRCNGYGLNLVFFGSDQFAGAGTITYNDFENCNRFIDLRLPTGVWEVGWNRCDGMKLIPEPDTNNFNYNTSAVFSHASGGLNFHDNYLGSTDAVYPMRVFFDRASAGFQFKRNYFGAPKQPNVRLASADTNAIPAWNWEQNVWVDLSQVAQPKTVIPHP